MRISTSKAKSDALWHLTPTERVALILEYQKQREVSGKDYEKEITQVQQNISKDQKNKYAETAFLVIFTNRTLFEFYLLLTNDFYQTYAGFLQTLLSFIISSTKTNINFDTTIKLYKKKLIEIYQSLLACDAVVKTISEETSIRNVIYPCYEKYFQKTNEKVEILINSVAKNRAFKPNSEAQEMIIKTIYQSVNRQLFEGL